MILVSICAFLLWLPVTAVMFFGLRRIPVLNDVPPAPDEVLPSLSVVVPACNEAATVEPAMRSLLALDYPRLEIVAVNDRSTDATGAILDALAASDTRLRVLHVSELPAGWLGKNHALEAGSRTATGEWLLFTDADVSYRQDTLRRVLAWTAASGFDHVVAVPRVLLHGFWEPLFVSYFSVGFNARFRPWDVPNPRSPAYMGVGAFNLVRAEAYRSAGGHAALPMEVADDVKLGKILKRGGFRTGIIEATDWVSVRWVVGLRGIIDGLTKNSFAGFEYRLAPVAGWTLVILLTHFLPGVGWLWTPPLARAFFLATLGCMVWAAAAVQPSTRVPAWYGLGYPLAALLLIYILLRSAALTLRQGGIVWRGTHYPLDELRRGVV